VNRIWIVYQSGGVKCKTIAWFGPHAEWVAMGGGHIVVGYDENNIIGRAGIGWQLLPGTSDRTWWFFGTSQISG